MRTRRGKIQAPAIPNTRVPVRNTGAWTGRFQNTRFWNRQTRYIGLNLAIALVALTGVACSDETAAFCSEFDGYEQQVHDAATAIGLGDLDTAAAIASELSEAAATAPESIRDDLVNQIEPIEEIISILQVEAQRASGASNDTSRDADANELSRRRAEAESAANDQERFERIRDWFISECNIDLTA